MNSLNSDIIYQINFWLFIINGLLLVIHEIDAAYWKEWTQFRDTFGWFRSRDDKKNEAVFLLLHIPMIGLIFWGIIETYKYSEVGLMLSAVIAFGGIFAFFFHGYWLRKGSEQFNAGLSRLILLLLLLSSIAQIFTVAVCALKDIA